jgi:hypothetical protein
MDLVKVLEHISDDAEVIQQALDEWFMGRREPDQEKHFYNVVLRGTAGVELKVSKLEPTEDLAVKAAEDWANNHARFSQFGPWAGKSLGLDD